MLFRVEGSFGTPGFQTAASCIDWALAERVVALHGGALQERDDRDDRATPGGPHVIALFLPLIKLLEGLSK